MKCLSVLTENLRILANDGTTELSHHKGFTLLLLANIEVGDTKKDVHSVKLRLKNILEQQNSINSRRVHPPESIVILPFAHLSEHSSPDMEHVNKVLTMLSKELHPLRKTLLMRTQATDSLLANLALFDSVITTKHHMTRTSLTLLMKSLLNAFSLRTIERALYDAHKKR